ncbi:NAD(P)H-dependent glycerol-3-phosphate dehydrogenase [Roseicyclus amphidinii]|uniref:NAD(P)H-dependent glycerol-3-phosphate dehydrogenase n=1 Tax=Roseicyclus amphidinii TaxID=3034232 RepID=UPI0024E0A842|nr:NAD(P)H-dependent glycerol-3-phosphate dehydrogenase [Roseicyclus sp. Amp-Y-6]
MSAPLDIIGAGAFGTALAITYAKAGHPVTLWAREGAAAMHHARENTRRLPGHRFPETLRITGDLADLTADCALLALPTQSLGPFLAATPLAAKTLVSCAKGIDRATGLGPTALIAQHSTATPAQLTGPSFAVDIAASLPTALTLACADDATGAALQARLSTATLRLYRTTDVIGAELGGALKNVVAIAAGAVIGAGLGDSARAALMARGLAEMTRIAVAEGAEEATLTGLSGLGDLILTCGSEKSRNFRFGAALARGESLPPDTTVEGLHTARQIAARGQADTPIAAAVAALADGRADVATIADMLLNRPLKPE